MGHQLVGVIAISIAFVAILRGWGAPAGLVWAAGLAGVAVTILTAASDGRRIDPVPRTRPAHEELQAQPDPYAPSQPVQGQGAGAYVP